VLTKFFCRLAVFPTRQDIVLRSVTGAMLPRGSPLTSSRSPPGEHRYRAASKPDYTLGRCNRPQVGRRLHSTGSSDKNTEPEDGEAPL
jgi:hypothetical protein